MRAKQAGRRYAPEAGKDVKVAAWERGRHAA